MNPLLIFLALMIAGIALRYLLCGAAPLSPENILGSVVKDPLKAAEQVTTFVTDQVQNAIVRIATTYLKLIWSLNKTLKGINLN